MVEDEEPGLPAQLICARFKSAAHVATEWR
jgi:hypothetical protein